MALGSIEEERFGTVNLQGK